MEKRDYTGYDVALGLAVSWREQAIENLNKAGAGYSERHGM